MFSVAVGAPRDFRCPPAAARGGPFVCHTHTQRTVLFSVSRMSHIGFFPRDISLEL